VRADISVDTVIVMGAVEGKILAQNKIELMAPGSIIGSIEASVVSISEGAKFDGTCTMAPKNKSLPVGDKKQ